MSVTVRTQFAVTAADIRYSRTATADLAPRRPLAFRGNAFETEGSSVEVKIGVTDSPRELSFNTDALSKDSSVLALTDEKGRRFLVQSAKIAYVEIGAADVRRVGFGVGVVGAEAVKNG